MLAVGVTSDKVTKIKAVATIEPPPKQASTASSQIAFKGNMLGKEPENLSASVICKTRGVALTNDILPGSTALHRKNVHHKQPFPAVLVREHAERNSEEQAWQMAPETSPSPQRGQLGLNVFNLAKLFGYLAIQPDFRRIVSTVILLTVNTFEDSDHGSIEHDAWKVDGNDEEGDEKRNSSSKLLGFLVC